MGLPWAHTDHPGKSPHLKVFRVTDPAEPLLPRVGTFAPGSQGQGVAVSESLPLPPTGALTYLDINARKHWDVRIMRELTSEATRQTVCIFLLVCQLPSC